MTRSQIRPAMQAAIEAAAMFATIDVVLDDGSSTRADAMEAALRADGVVVAVAPILGSLNRDQAGQRLAEDARVTVHLRTKPGGAFNADDGVDAILKAVLAASTNLHAKLDQEPTALVEDPGLLTYAIRFLIPITNPSS